MKFFYKLVRLNSCYSSDFRCSRVVYAILLVRMMQLAALLGYCGQFSVYGQQGFFQTFLNLLSFTNPTSWMYLATGEGILITIGLFSICHLALQIHIGYLVFSSARLESDRILIFGYKFFGFIFDELMLIPILSWLFFKFVPNTSLSGSHLTPIVFNSPTWLYVLTIVIFSVDALLHTIGKVSDISFRHLINDRIKTMSLLFEGLRVAFPVAIVALASYAQASNLDLLWPCLLSIIYALTDLALSFYNVGYKNPTSRKLHCVFMAFYLTHSTFYLILGKLSPSQIQSALNFLDILYFFSFIFVVKLILISYKCFVDSRSYFGQQKHSGHTKRRIFEEMQDLLVNTENSSSLQIYLEHRSIISHHIATCKEKSCYCSSWKEFAKENPSVFLPNSKEFMEIYYEDLLKGAQKQNQPDMWVFIDFVLIQALRLEKIVKACFLLQRFRSVYTNRYERFVIECLSLFLEEHFLKNLASARNHFDVSFLNGIKYDARYKKMIEHYEQIHKEKSDFFQYLIESVPVDLNKLDEKGKVFMKSALAFQKEMEESLEDHESVEIMALLIKFKQEIMDKSVRETRSLQRRLDILYLKKTSKHVPGHNNSEEDHFDYLDSNNIFLAIDLVQNIGEIIDHNSRVFLELGHRSDKAKLTTKMLVPRYVYDCLLSSLLKALNQSRYLETSSKYVQLTFLFDSAGHIVPYEACLKVEFMRQRGLCGAVALKRFPTQSQFILTKPSGEIISLTIELLQMLRIESVGNIIGKNICFIIPELFKYYLETSSKSEELYPNQNLYSLKFDAIGILEKHLLDRSSTNLYSTSESDEINNCLISINNQDSIDPEQAAVISQKFQSFARKLLLQAFSKYQISLRVRRYNLDDKKPKVIEVFSCKSRPTDPIKQANMTKLLDKEIVSLFENSPTDLRKQNILNKSLDQEPKEIAPEGQTAIENFYMSRQDDFKFTMLSGLRPSRDTIALNLRFNLTDQERDQSRQSYMHTGEEDKDNTLKDAKNSVWRNISSIRNSKSYKEIDLQQNLVTDEQEFYADHSKQETQQDQDTQQDQEDFKQRGKKDHEQAVELNSPQKVSSNDSNRPENSSSASKKMLKMNVLDAIQNASLNPHLQAGHTGSKASSSLTTTTKSERIKYIIQHNFAYKILQFNFVVGICGVLLIISLFTTQYVGYTIKLNQLTLLCTSMGYPAQLATHIELLTQAAYRWELYTNGWVQATWWFVTMISTVNFPSFLSVTSSFTSLLLNAQNVSVAVNSYLAAPENMVTLNYIDGTNVTMAIELALLIDNQDAKQFYTDEVQKGKITPVDIRDAYILDANTNMLFDKMLNMTEYLYNDVQTSVDSILSFNVILLVVVSTTIALLAFSCVIMYMRINSKRVRMLSLFCTLSKSDLEKEWLRFNDKPERGKESTKMKSGLITKQQKLGARRAFHEFSYQNKNKWPAMISFFFIFGLFLVPFVYNFTQTRDQIMVSYQGVSDIRTLALYAAHYASYFTNEIRYYTNINGSSTLLSQIDQRVADEYNSCQEQFPNVQAFLVNYGNLIDQDIYGASVTWYVTRGILDVCTAINQTAYYTTVCKNVSNGIGNQGIIEAVNYLFTESERIYEQIVNATNQTQELINIGKSIDIFDLSFLVVSSNRLFRITIDAMTYDVVQYMRAINAQALRDYIAITVSILLVLGTGWIIWIKRLETWLNKTKEIYNIIPIGLLEGNPAIKGYFKQELRNASDI